MDNDNERARVAFVGVGRWGRELADGAVASGAIEVVACFSRTPETRAAFAADYACRAAESIGAILDDPAVDGVVIASTNSTHRELIEAAAAAGKGMFVDKPLTLSASDSRAAVAAADAAGVVLQVGYQRRRLPANRKIRAMIDAGELGDVLLLEAQQSSPNGLVMAASAWRWDPIESPLGSMTSLGVHSIETLSYLGGRIERVSATVRRDRLGRSIDEATGLLFEFESGAVGTLVSSFFTPQLSRLSVHGTEAAAFMDDDGTRLATQLRGSTDQVAVALTPTDAIAEQMGEFGRALRGGPAPETGGREGLVVDLVMAAAEESVRSRRAVDVERVG
ncbi:MAG TPA: Gfo/Idh/MocA family oxidoreductase [Ilumatobacter sp.]|nr:Gfo/Idh/MocA family oxidoreductase [Ilumatobacter sp.]